VPVVAQLSQGHHVRRIEFLEYAIDRFEREVREALENQARIPPELLNLATPKPGIPADLALPVVRLARARNIAPPSLAQELAAFLDLPPMSLAGRWAASGPFLNFTLHPGHLASTVVSEVALLGTSYGHDDRTSGQTAVVEYSSPNMARRMHVGHVIPSHGVDYGILPKHMHVTSHLSIEELERRYRRAHDPVERTHYQDCPVVTAPTSNLRTARLRLVAATAQSLANGLKLLGIEAPDSM